MTSSNNNTRIYGGGKRKKDPFLETLDRWTSWTIATFSWLALLIAISVALIIELGAVIKVYGEVFPGHPDNKEQIQRPAPVENKSSFRDQLI
jgi:hypothetical protein